MATLYHQGSRKSNIKSKENTAEKTFYFPPFFWQTDKIRPLARTNTAGKTFS